MTSNVGRGRGYAGKNKDIVRAPAGVSDTERFSYNPNLQKDSSHQDKTENVFNFDIEKSNKNQIMGKTYRNRNSDAMKHSKTGEYEESGAKEYTVTKDKEKTSSESTRKSKEFLRAISVSDENRQSVLFIDDSHHYLLKQVNLLSQQDDGILFNQKLQHIGDILSKNYKDHSSLRNALDAIASAAILDSRISAKVSLLCCSVWFSCYQIHGEKLHSMFIEALNDKIEGLEVSLEGADQYLVNAASLLSNIFTETKMLKADELKTIARLIVQVSIELLECYTPLALKTLNIQLMVHGRKLYQSVPDKVESLSISARKLLIAKQPPAPSCRIWLTLLADQCLCKLEPLPKYLEDFYSVHLDESQNVHEEKTYSKQNDHSHYSDVRNANVSYDKSRRSDSSDIYSVHSNGERSDCDPKYSDDVFDDKNIQHESSFDSSGISDTNISDNHDNSFNTSLNSERKPRPILGAGVRFGQIPNKLDTEVHTMSNVHILNDNKLDIPGFCPSVPPPNFVSKAVTSASQDSGDYWNKPPPPLPNKKKPNPAPSALSKRLDLNSWRQENCEAQEECTEENIQCDTESNDRNLFQDDQTNSQSQILLLEKMRKNDNNQQSDNLHRGEKKRPEKVYYERKHSGNSGRGDKNWDEPDVSGLQISPSNENKNNTGRNNTNRNQSSGFNKAYNNENRRDQRQRNERQSFNKSDSDDIESNWRSSTKENQGDKKQGFHDKKSSDEEEKKPRNSGKREQRAGGTSSRDNMEVFRGGSYWTHDDRCDKDYDE